MVESPHEAPKKKPEVKNANDQFWMAESIGSGFAQIKTLPEPGPSSKPNFGGSSEEEDVQIISNAVKPNPIAASKPEPSKASVKDSPSPVEMPKAAPSAFSPGQYDSESDKSTPRSPQQKAGRDDSVRQGMT